MPGYFIPTLATLLGYFDISAYGAKADNVTDVGPDVRHAAIRYPSDALVAYRAHLAGHVEGFSLKRETGQNGKRGKTGNGTKRETGRVR
jgi:hypothetical protein